MEAMKKKGNQDDQKKLQKEIQFQLNILTPENFEQVKLKILNLFFSPEQEFLIEYIFKKAMKEFKYVKTYSQLCFNIQIEEKKLRSQNQSIDSSDKKPEKDFVEKLIDKIFNNLLNEEIFNQYCDIYL
ncbi:Armadillo-type fold [Pseudocohnilembus persalinus]|uniref:Armadillo-type fold n=1 Tax=Pseudocohnilembus persalinus TaxID=266149 RepID=A0A0V0QBK2_PSEPJ|nr:Armadillo-type fold [Pseudocohnilembus persalinus]|eukprot:KRW99463.1 Armadillo-type fold [Pseudocohnilembus persalinus]